MLSGSVVVCLVHYLLANTYAWATMPEYEKSLAGWWQSQTIGLPGPFPPAIAFLRNALVGNGVWCLFAALVWRWQAELKHPAEAATA